MKIHFRGEKRQNQVKIKIIAMSDTWTVVTENNRGTYVEVIREGFSE